MSEYSGPVADDYLTVRDALWPYITSDTEKYLRCISSLDRLMQAALEREAVSPNIGTAA